MILRLSQVTALVGLSRSSIYNQITNKTFPPQISLGGRSAGWVRQEVDTVLQARIAGYTEPQLQELVNDLVAKRRTKVAPLLDKA